MCIKATTAAIRPNKTKAAAFNRNKIRGKGLNIYKTIWETNGV